MVSGKQMNWEHELEQGREGPEGSMCSMEMEKTEQEHAEQQARLKEVGIAELGGRHCTSELQPSVMKLGDVWIKLVMLLCERENSAERHSWVSCG